MNTLAHIPSIPAQLIDYAQCLSRLSYQAQAAQYVPKTSRPVTGELRARIVSVLKDRPGIDPIEMNDYMPGEAIKAIRKTLDNMLKDKLVRNGGVRGKTLWWLTKKGAR